MRVLLLGATGEMGGRTASELLRNRDVQHLTLAGRNRARLGELAVRLGGRAPIEVAAFDIHSSGDLVARCSDHDLVVSCAGPGYELEVSCVRAAIEARTNYISLNDDFEAASQTRSLGQAATEAGVSIVTGCGAAPGLSGLLATLAARDLDAVDEVEIAVGASSRDGGGSAAELHFVSMLGTSDSATSRPGSPHPVYFPEPVGWVETFGCPHPEEVSLAETTPGAAVRFRIGLAEKAVMDVIRASVATRVTASEPLKRAWLKGARPLRPILEQMTPGQGGWTAVRVDVHGRRDGRARTISYGIVDHLVNLASIALGEGAARTQSVKAGVFAAEEAFDAKELLLASTKRGLRFARLEPHEL